MYTERGSTPFATIDSSRRKASKGFSEISGRLVRSEMNHVIFRKNRFVPSNRSIETVFKAPDTRVLTREGPGPPPTDQPAELTRTHYDGPSTNSRKRSRMTHRPAPRKRSYEASCTETGTQPTFTAVTRIA